MHQRHSLKFLHSMGAIGLMGSMACLVVLAGLTPPPGDLAGYALMRGAMGEIAQWVFMPSLGLTLVAGLLAPGLNRAFHNAGWAWVKLATGVLMFAGGLVDIQGQMVEEAQRSADALAGRLDPAALTGAAPGETNLLWILLAVSTANVVLGIWRPRLIRRSAAPAPVVEPEAVPLERL